ncbi:hypothetical protein V6N13_016326 [Hibiscus sabdariffa]|uniref:4-hydroxy-4-methyl-2-oxoglutarate aldolase n=1 Tax=Hibiscus sabdariffa TaxID=183260 RepID=A0ABR1ZZ75_9ROSI
MHIGPRSFGPEDKGPPTAGRDMLRQQTNSHGTSNYELILFPFTFTIGFAFLVCFLTLFSVYIRHRIVKSQSNRRPAASESWRLLFLQLRLIKMLQLWANILSLTHLGMRMFHQRSYPLLKMIGGTVPHHDRVVLVTTSPRISHLHNLPRSLCLCSREHMATFATAEACDSNTALLASGELRALEPIFKIYGQRRAFSGPIATLKVFEDNVLVRQLLETRGEGRVLVIDGGGSTRCALVGGNLAQSAQNMGWAGIVVNGCIRDVDEINACDIGVRALGSNPLKSNKKAVGDKHIPINIAGTFIRDGEWLYADSDGILISKMELSI